MAEKITCWIRKPIGNSLKATCKNGLPFTVKGKTYNAPNADNREVLETMRFGSRKRVAFYVEGQPNAIPISREYKWHRLDLEKENDVDILVKITAKALLEVNEAALKAKMMVGGIGLAIVFIIIFVVAL